ncbi:mycothiol synthase [Subtercola sp. YIM 133946]|uniref:mycothiol synthase n=1 Tax=Subtercola sp. YIM 133946 TaxID=3118909 RepID=UPI002F951240
MNDSLRLETLRAADREALLASRGYRDLVALGSAAVAADGQPPFNDQTLVAARAGRCVFTLAYSGQALAGAAVVNDDTLELVIDPALRGRGLGAALTSHMLDEDSVFARRRRPHVSYLSRLLEPFQSDVPVAIPTLAWSHGDHPAAAALAKQHHFAAVRRLLQLRMPLDASMPEPPQLTRVDAFVPGVDDEAWVALNARIFSGHPEQGQLSVDDLRARMAEPWFDAGDFLVARGNDGELIGYNWLKIEPGETVGEIYVIGVDAGHSARGIGRELMLRGLKRLVSRGCTVAALYVDEGNTPAVPLYRSLGFTDFTVDVQYARP